MRWDHRGNKKTVGIDWNAHFIFIRQRSHSFLSFSYRKKRQISFVIVQHFLPILWRQYYNAQFNFLGLVLYICVVYRQWRRYYATCLWLRPTPSDDQGQCLPRNANRSRSASHKTQERNSGLTEGPRLGLIRYELPLWKSLFTESSAVAEMPLDAPCRTYQLLFVCCLTTADGVVVTL